MTHPEASPSSASTGAHPLWTRALLPLLLSLIGVVLGWHLSESGHPRLASASQTLPVLPDLRPVAAPQPSIQGGDGLAEAPVRVLAPGRTRWWPLPAYQAPHLRLDLSALGRLNTDGG